MQRRVWALADPHLSFANPKPMDIFGSHWANHAQRISVQCGRLVQESDLLLIPGDISWAMKKKDAEPDLQFLSKLPGIKVLCKGNHDYWWDSDKPLNYTGLFDTPYSLPDGRVGIAGTRGWISTTADMSDQERHTNQRIISRECNRLNRRLDAIDRCQIKFVMVHYPPLEEFRQILIDHGVHTILYGHLHLRGNDPPLSEDWHGIRSLCVAADRINFTPKLVGSLS